MEIPQSSEETSTAISGPTTNSQPCFHFTGVYFEAGSSTLPYFVNAFLNVLLALVTTVANTIALSAIRKNTSLYLPSKILLGSLALTDLGVGIAVQPLFVTFLVAKAKGFTDMCFAYASFGISACVLVCVSVLTMTAISLDRYIALYFHLRYRDIVTTKRVFSVVVVIWLFAGFFGFLWLRNPILHGYVLIAFTSVSSIIITLSYTMIYRGLHHHNVNPVTAQVQVQTQQQAANPLNVARYRRSASNMLWIYVLFVLCFLPFVLTRIVVQLVGRTVLLQCLLEFATTVVCFNSCLNPFVYCYRLPEIRASVLETLHKICGQSSQQWIQVSRDS